ncbi:MAG: acyl carrier protein [Planctomycetota bacterium]
MTPDEIRTTVIAALKQIAPDTDPASIDPDEDLREELDIDSMDFLNFITALHVHLSVEIPEADASKLATINGALAYLQGRVA